MKHSFNVTLNNQIIYSYTEKPAPARLRRFMDEMDSDMQESIKLGDFRVDKPNDLQKLQYVAMQLFDAIDKDDLNHAEVMSAYLINRNNDLSAIHFTVDKDIVNLKLSFT